MRDLFRHRAPSPVLRPVRIGLKLFIPACFPRFWRAVSALSGLPACRDPEACGFGRIRQDPALRRPSPRSDGPLSAGSGLWSRRSVGMLQQSCIDTGYPLIAGKTEPCSQAIAFAAAFAQHAQRPEWSGINSECPVPQDFCISVRRTGSVARRGRPAMAHFHCQGLKHGQAPCGTLRELAWGLS